MSLVAVSAEDGAAPQSVEQIHADSSALEMVPPQQDSEAPTSLSAPPSSASQCAHKGKPCSKERLNGYQYCLSHILDDKSAPFKRCTSVHPENKRRCIRPVPSEEADPALCNFHKKKQREESIKGSSETKENVSVTSTPSRKRKISPSENAKSAASEIQSVTSESLLSKIVDRSGMMGKVALLATEEDLAYLEAGALVRTDRRSQIRSRLISLQLQALRGEIALEKEYITAPSRAADELASICSLISSRIPSSKSLEHVAVPGGLMGPPLPQPSPKKKQKPQAEPAAPGEAPPPKKKAKKVETSSTTATETTPTDTKPKKIKKAAQEVTEPKAPPKPKRKTKDDYSATCTYVGCSEKSVPMLNFCFAHLLNEPGQMIYQSCTYEGCNFPIPKFASPALCALHDEMSAKQKKAKAATADIQSSPSAIIPTASAILDVLKGPSDASTEASPAAAKKAASRKRKAPADDGASSEAPKPKKPRKSKAASAATPASPAPNQLEFVPYQPPLPTPTADSAPITLKPGAWDAVQEEADVDIEWQIPRMPSSEAKQETPEKK